MIRASLLLVIGAVAALVALKFAGDPGAVTVRLGKDTIETSALFALIVLMLTLAAALPAFRVLLVALGAPQRLTQAAYIARQQKAQEALALGLLAAEGGDPAEARRQAQRAVELVEEPRLDQFAAAATALAAGDRAGAERAFASMAVNEESELLGRRGLVDAALARGDRLAAMTHAEAALKRSRSARWPFETLYDLQLAEGRWEAAIATIEAAEQRKLIAEEVAGRRKAALFVAAALVEERERRIEKASDFAQRAQRAAPDFPPAAAAAARLLVAEGKAWKAQAVLEESWEARPHPALAHLYRDIKADEPEGERRRRLFGLVEAKPEHREARILAAELAIAQSQWQAASENLDHAYREHPSQRLCALYAQLARSRGDEEGARRWAAQGFGAAREGDWSDIAPDGAAFAYPAADWASLVRAFGEDGRLAHPRLERGEREIAGGSILALPAAIAGASAADAAAWTRGERSAA